MLISLDCLEQTRMFLVPQSISAVFEVIKNGCRDLWLSKKNETKKQNYEMTESRQLFLEHKEAGSKEGWTLYSPYRPS